MKKTVRQATIYSKSSGLEVREWEKRPRKEGGDAREGDASSLNIMTVLAFLGENNEQKMADILKEATLYDGNKFLYLDKLRAGEYADAWVVRALGKIEEKYKEYLEVLRKNDELVQGRISYRFFTFEKGNKGNHKSMRFVAEPREANRLCQHVYKVAAAEPGTKGKLEPHKIEEKGKEPIMTTLSFEKWKSGTGYAFMLNRGKESINVPCNEDDFLYIADFSRFLANECSFVEVKV